MYNFISFPCICQPKNLRNSYGFFLFYTRAQYISRFFCFLEKNFFCGSIYPAFLPLLPFCGQARWGAYQTLPQSCISSRNSPALSRTRSSSNACARCPQSRLKPLATCLLLCAQTVLFAPQYYFPKASVSPLRKLYA